MGDVTMCIAALVETELTRIGALLGLPQLAAHDETAAPDELTRRIESRGEAWVVCQRAGGRLVAERMAYNPYLVRRRNIVGDMWASSLLAANHGIVVLRGFSEWVSAEVLVGLGLIGVHDAHCAFNRVGPGRQLLANFTAGSGLLAPALYDLSRGAPEFVLLVDEPPPPLRRAGLGYAPFGLTAAAAHEWLHTGADHSSEPGEPGEPAPDGAFAIDFEEVLKDGLAEPFAFSLYKSA